MRSSLAVSPSSSRPAGMPVQAATTSAMSSAPTSSLTIGGRRVLGGLGRPAASSFSSAGISPYSSRDGGLEVAVALGALGLAAQVVELLLELADPVQAGLLPLPAGVERVELLLAVGQLGAQPVQPLPGRRVGLLGSSASSSIFSRSTARCSSSISTGRESISMRSRDAASSTRSIALSGRNRAVM